MTGGLPPAPRWAWVVMTLGVAVIVALSYLSLNRPPPPRFSSPASADTTATSGPADMSTDPARRTSETAQTRVLVVGDDFSLPPTEGEGWPQLVRDDLQSAGHTVELTVTARDQAGYAEPDPAGLTFPRLVQEAGSGFDLVVLFGSRYDIAAAGDVQAAVTTTFEAVRAASPDASVVVIGPAWPNGNPPGYIVTNRDAAAAAAGPFGAVFVDPLTEGWFTGAAADLVTLAGPTSEGHRYLADLIGPVVDRLVEDRG